MAVPSEGRVNLKRKPTGDDRLEGKEKQGEQEALSLFNLMTTP